MNTASATANGVHHDPLLAVYREQLSARVDGLDYRRGVVVFAFARASHMSCIVQSRSIFPTGADGADTY